MKHINKINLKSGNIVHYAVKNLRLIFSLTSIHFTACSIAEHITTNPWV